MIRISENGQGYFFHFIYLKMIRNRTKADQVAAKVQSANFKSVLPKVSKLKKFFLIKITVKLAN